MGHHYQRKENQSFPVLESKGITGPTRVMWGVDDEIRKMLKDPGSAIALRDAEAFARLVDRARMEVAQMIYKEEHILFPLCSEHFDGADWARVAAGESALGYGLARDEVVFYSDNPDRIFPRTPRVIGRKVQFCLLPKSLHLVQQILDDFRQGMRNHAEFRIRLGEAFVRIGYFAVRDPGGAYLGCLEVIQDIAPLQSLRDEKRLLD